jgi:hypothetical protein
VTRQELATAMRTQRDWCRKLGSPFYFDLLGCVADDLEAGGACWQVLKPLADAPARSLLPLRFLGGIHRLVLSGKLPELARHFPGDSQAAWVELIRALHQQGDRIRESIPDRVQTNEVGRCAALLPGFQEILRRTGLPLRLLEVGCSAGLNLRFDQYELTEGPIEVVERKGCDLHPIELDDDGRLTLLSFVWPDQKERFAQLSRAIEISRCVPAVIEQADAIEWLSRELKSPVPGAATVVFHSIVTMYFSNADRARLPDLLAEAGSRASDDAPLAWLSMEQSGNPTQEREGRETDIDLTIWPGGERRTIARASFHGRNVEMLAR